MILSDISIRRPVLATVMSLGLVLLGLMSFQRLPVREYPNIDAPVVSVISPLNCAFDDCPSIAGLNITSAATAMNTAIQGRRAAAFLHLEFIAPQSLQRPPARRKPVRATPAISLSGSHSLCAPALWG